MIFVPSGYFPIAGYGDDDSELLAFDSALLNMGIGNVNLLKLSSTLAPKASKSDPRPFAAGAFVGAAYAHIISHEPGLTIAAAIALARPTDNSCEGVIMEFSGSCSAAECEAVARRLAERSMANRNVAKFTVEVASCEHKVKNTGCCIAAVVQF